MKDIRGTLAKQNLGVERFSKLIGTTLKSIHKYEKGDETLKNSTKARIEHGLYLVEQSGIIWPDISKYDNPQEWWIMNIYREKVYECNKQFRIFMKEFEESH